MNCTVHASLHPAIQGSVNPGGEDPAFLHEFVIVPGVERSFLSEDVLFQYGLIVNIGASGVPVLDALANPPLLLTPNAVGTIGDLQATVVLDNSREDYAEVDPPARVHVNFLVLDSGIHKQRNVAVLGWDALQQMITAYGDGHFHWGAPDGQKS